MPSLLTRLFRPPSRPIPTGLYHYQSPPDDLRNYRLHLRVEADGGGILIINAATILHLNLTAVEYAYAIVQNWTADQATERMVERYDVSTDQARRDYQDLVARIQTLVNTPDLDPVTFLDFELAEPFSGQISAPYRLDCALTYRHDDQQLPEAEIAGRVQRELTTSEWLQIIAKAWSAAIPHIVFTGGEPTLRDDLPELLAQVERNDQVSGLVSDGLRLVDRSYLDRLLAEGLDHLMLVLHPEDPRAWAAVQNCLDADLFLSVHLTIMPENTDLRDELERLTNMGVRTVSLSASRTDLNPYLQAARQQVAELGLDLVWNLPAPYSGLNPVALELGMERPSGAGRAWLYVEPDGDVLPAQGINIPLGNLLNSEWDEIWKKQG